MGVKKPRTKENFDGGIGRDWGKGVNTVDKERGSIEGREKRGKIR